MFTLPLKFQECFLSTVLMTTALVEIFLSTVLTNDFRLIINIFFRLLKNGRVLIICS